MSFLYTVKCHCPLLQRALPEGCCFPAPRGGLGLVDPPGVHPGFGPLGRWGGWDPWEQPPCPLVCVYIPGPCSLQPSPQPARRLWLPHRACPLPRGAWQGIPLAPRWAPEGLRNMGRGHRWPFSLRDFSKGYSAGWAWCLLLLSDTNSCHGCVWVGIMLQMAGDTSCWPWSMLVL